MSVEMRTCNVCGQTKSLKQSFHRNGKDKEGNPAYRLDCRDCYTITRNIKKRHKVNKFINNTKHRTGEEVQWRLIDWRDALLHFRGACAYCGVKQSRKIKLTKEHVVPVSHGGKTTRRNIIPACLRCNSSKSSSDWEEWFVRQVFYVATRVERIRRWIEQ